MGLKLEVLGRIVYFLPCRRIVYTELLPTNDRRINRQTHRNMYPSTFLLLCEFVTVGTFLQSRYLAMKQGYTHTRTGGSDLRSTLLQWALLTWYTYQILYRLVQAFKSSRGIRYNRQIYNRSCCLVLEWGLVSHLEESTNSEGVWDKDGAENVWAKGGLSNESLEKIM
jgi:hypothetical protein